MSSPADGAAPPGFWGCRALRGDGTTAWVAGTGSDRHADGEMVELPEAEAAAYMGDSTLARAQFDLDGGVIGLWVSSTAAPKAPPMWYAELPEVDAARPTLNLVAFTGHDVEPGRLLTPAELRATGASTSDQLGAIRLYPASGEVDQLYVTPEWRRRTVGTALTFAAFIMVFARGQSLLWSDGQRTADGDRMTKASVWRHRAAPLTNLAPPMTPFDER